MTEAKTLLYLTQLGLHYTVQQTGDPRWKRIFISMDIKDEVRVQVGRVSIFEGNYSHIKWYGISYNEQGEIRECEHLAYQWNYLLQMGKLLDPAHYEACLNKAWELAHERRAAIQAKRQANSRREDGKPVKRKGLAPANPRRFLWELLVGGSNKPVHAAIQPV